MNPRLIRRIGRWAGAAALLVALAAGAMFAHRQWQASRAVRHAPPAVPPSVRQRSLQFTFSKMDGQQTVFTIHAARATRYSNGHGSVLEDVDIVVHGEHGERHDEMRTRSCEYEATTGGIVCHGTVRLDLSGVPFNGTGSPLPGGGIHVKTSGVSFNRDTGAATTNAPVSFRFPEGEGSGIGADYSSRAADFHVRRDVKIRLEPSGPEAVATLVTSPGGLTFDRQKNRLQVVGPVEIRQAGRRIDTGELTVDLNNRLRPQRAIASGTTRVFIARGPRQGTLQANGAEIQFDGRGRAVQMNLSGHVHAVEQRPQTKLQAQSAMIQLNPVDQQPRMVEAKGNVRFEANRPGGLARLESGTLRLMFAPIVNGEKRSRLTEALAPGEAKTQWVSQKGTLALQGGRLAATFGADNQIQTLRATGGVSLDRQLRDQPPLRTRARELAVHFSHGAWTEVEESGAVHARQGARRASSDHATWMRATDAIRLSGRAFVSDPSGQTFADEIDWNQKSGRLRAMGHVRTSYTGANAGKVGPVNIVAASLDANSATDRAVYKGSARLWGEDHVVQADRIEFDRKENTVLATGNVLAAFPQAPRPVGTAGNGKTELGRSSAPAAASKAGGGLVMWRVRADRLEYVQVAQGETGTGGSGQQAARVGGKVTFQGHVEAWSSQGRIRAKVLVLSLRRVANGRVGLTRATAGGGVVIRQGTRWGEARNARYDAQTGEFVLWGGKPSLKDASGDLVRGDRLTFSVADDTISVESSEGSRTLTRHPVPN